MASRGRLSVYPKVMRSGGAADSLLPALGRLALRGAELGDRLYSRTLSGLSCAAALAALREEPARGSRRRLRPCIESLRLPAPAGGQHSAARSCRAQRPPFGAALGEQPARGPRRRLRPAFRACLSPTIPAPDPRGAARFSSI
jgi:hypothetical protein